MMNPIVMLMALASALVAVGSCVLNDWFDRRVDRVNKPDSALVQGRVPPTHALLISLAALGAAFGTSYAVSGVSALSSIVRAAVVAVTLYTPCFKPVPFIKNLVVAAVTGGACWCCIARACTMLYVCSCMHGCITHARESSIYVGLLISFQTHAIEPEQTSASLALGGLATGSPLQAVAAPTALVFLGIYHREILMDIDDVEGDAQGQIMTLPRLLGRRGALWVASTLFAGASLLSAHYVLMQVGTSR